MKLLKSLLMITCIPLLSSCGIKEKTIFDQSIAQSQALATVACYQALKDNAPDMTTWTADQINSYNTAKQLETAMKLLAKVPLDPCSGAGGTNVYDADIAIAKTNSETTGKWLSFGESLATKGLIAYGLSEFFGFLDGANSTDIDINGSGNTFDGIGNDGSGWSLTKNPFTDNSLEVIAE